MAINKVVYGNNTLMDITDTTATADDVASGQVFYRANGVRTVGTGSGGGSGIPVLTSPVYISGLTPGVYKLPAGCNVYDDQENAANVCEIVNGGLIYVDTIIDSGHTAYAFTIINDNSTYEYDESSPAVYGEVLYQYGIVSPDTYDYWNLSEFFLNRCVTKIALNNVNIYGVDGVASIKTEGTYNSSSNKLTTKSYVNEALNSFCAPTYSTSSTYNQGDLVYYDGKMYYCNDDNVTGTWNSNKWVQTSLGDFFQGMNYIYEMTGDLPVNIGGIFDYLLNMIPQMNVAAVYSRFSTYNVGDYVTYEGGLWKCKNQITTPEAWNVNHWTPTTIVNSMTKSESIAPDYSAGTMYSIGDYVMYNGQLYVCSSEMLIADPGWVAGHWTKTNISTILGNINSALGGI